MDASVQQLPDRYLSTEGGRFAINSGDRSLPGGVRYGAVAGITDGGFGDFSINLEKFWLLANGTGNYDLFYMFGYQAIHVLTLLGQLFTTQYYNMSGKLFSYPRVARKAAVTDGVKSRGSPASTVSSRVLQHFGPPINRSNIFTQTSPNRHWDTILPTTLRTGEDPKRDHCFLRPLRRQV